MLDYYNQSADPVLEEKIALADKWWKSDYKTRIERIFGYVVQ